MNGKIKTYKPNFTPPGRSYTYLFRREVIRLLQKIRVQNAVAEIMKTPPYIIRSIMEDVVEQGMLNRGEIVSFKNISIDEKAFTKGRNYATIAKDLIKTWIDNSRTFALEFVNKALHTIENHMEGIAAALLTRTSSGLHENTNGRIRAIIAKARGFANFERFRINALFYYGNLQYDY